MDDLVALMDRDDLPPLALAALAHAQFETIHPFTDGNGRTGRALLHSVLLHTGVIHRVTVPISAGPARRPGGLLRGAHVLPPGRAGADPALRRRGRAHRRPRRVACSSAGCARSAGRVGRGADGPPGRRGVAAARPAAAPAGRHGPGRGGRARGVDRRRPRRRSSTPWRPASWSSPPDTGATGSTARPRCCSLWTTMRKAWVGAEPDGLDRAAAGSERPQARSTHRPCSWQVPRTAVTRSRGRLATPGAEHGPARPAGPGRRQLETGHAPGRLGSEPADRHTPARGVREDGAA